jgi:hypothetical protein
VLAAHRLSHHEAHGEPDATLPTVRTCADVSADGSGASALSEHFNTLGFLIIGLFVVCWLGSWAVYRWGGLDAIEAVRK